MSDQIFEDLLIHSCTIKRRVKGTADEWGVKSETLTEVATGVACLIQSAYEVLEFDVRGQKQTANFIGYFKIDCTIEVDDIIEFNSKSYAVIGVEDAGGVAHHNECPLCSLENKVYG